MEIAVPAVAPAVAAPNGNFRATVEPGRDMLEVG